MTTPAHDPLTCQCDNCRLDRVDFELVELCGRCAYHETCTRDLGCEPELAE